jgi:hypothetical protein
MNGARASDRVTQGTETKSGNCKAGIEILDLHCPAAKSIATYLSASSSTWFVIGLEVELCHSWSFDISSQEKLENSGSACIPGGTTQKMFETLLVIEAWCGGSIARGMLSNLIIIWLFNFSNTAID